MAKLNNSVKLRQNSVVRNSAGHSLVPYFWFPQGKYFRSTINHGNMFKYYLYLRIYGTKCKKTINFDDFLVVLAYIKFLWKRQKCIKSNFLKKKRLRDVAKKLFCIYTWERLQQLPTVDFSCRPTFCCYIAYGHWIDRYYEFCSLRELWIKSKQCHMSHVWWSV